MYIIYRRIAKIVSPYVAKVMTPNQVTLFRLLFFIPLSALFFALSYSYINILIAVFFLWMFGLFDYVDGEVARIRSMATSLGAQLDTNVDKIATGILLFGVTYGVYNNHYQNVIVWIIGFLALYGTNMKDYIIQLAGKEKEISKLTPSRAILNIFILPEYLIVFGALLNKMYIFLILIAVIINIRWISIFIENYFLNKSKSGEELQ